MAFWRTDSPLRTSLNARHAKAKKSRRSDNLLSGRTLGLEPCEQRLLLAVDPLQLISVIPNQGSLITNGQTLNVAPTQLTLNFATGESIDPTTLGAITITGAVGGVITAAVEPSTSTVVPNLSDSTGFRGIGTTPNQVVIRFDRDLPSDVYDIHIAGTGTIALKDLNGDVFNGGVNEDIQFTLDLGAQVASVVPQPVTRNSNGTLTQNPNEIDVYFTNNTLTTSSAQTVGNYELINTQNSATNADDTFVNPTTAVYNATSNMVKLTFAPGQVSAAGTYRLRVGNNDPLPVTPTSVNVAANPLTYPGDTLATAFTLGNFGSGVTTGTLQSVVATGAQITNVSAEDIGPYPGNLLDPGHRDIPKADEDDNMGGPGGPSIPVITYGFPTVYGTDPVSGSPLLNQITAQQEQVAEDIFAMYGKYLGAQFELVPSGGEINVITGDIRAIAPTAPANSAGGMAGFGLAIVNANDDWSGAASEYGGAWMDVAMHEIGHLLGYLHDDASPPLTIMNGGAESAPAPGSPLTTVPGLPAAEPVFPGDIDIVNGQQLIRPDANDINMYQFNVAQAGTVSLETIAERLPNASLLDTVLTVFDASGNKIASNDNYYGSDSFLQLDLQPGSYYVGVTSVGNTNYNPLVADSGSGGTSQGAYDLRLNFQPDAVLGLVSTASAAYPSGVPFDGDADGQPGGTYNFWFQVQSTANTIYVDKANNGTVYTGTGTLGTITNPYTNIATALAATTSGDVVRIVGNSMAQTNDAYAYNIGFNLLNQPLSDGSTMAVPKGVTVMIDNGGAGSTAVFKLSKANITVGSVSQGIDLSGGALQILGTPAQNVIFTSYNDQTVAPVTNPLVATPNAGDWGGIVFNGDADQAANGVFLDTVDHATISYGGGQVVVNSTEQVFDPIHLIDSQPSIEFNTILHSADAAMSGDPNSFADIEFQAAPNLPANPDYSPSLPTSNGYTADYGRTGPIIHGNIEQANSINGMFVRIRTQAGASLDQLTVPATFASTDITYVITENLEIATPDVLSIVNGQSTEIAGSSRIADGVGQVAGSLVIDPGVVVKLGGARIETSIGSGSQLIAEGTASNPVVLTSLLDTTYGSGGTFAATNNASQTPNPGDWGGLYFGPATSASLDYVILQYAGGSTSIEGGSDTFNPIEVYQANVRIADSTLQNNAGGGSSTTRDGRQSSTAAVIYVLGAQPVIVNNIIQNNTGPAISINANALNNYVVPDWGRSTDLANAYTQFSDNYGPLVRLNALANNTINGMLVRGAALTTQSIWDDTDIVHVLETPIEVGNMQTYTGLRLQSSSTQSLVIKLLGPDAGFTADGTLLDISDRIGGTVQVIGQPGHPVLMTSLNDSTVGAGFDPSGNPDNDTNNNPTSVGKPGDWQGITIGEYSNDTNLAEVNESEQSFVNGKDTNNTPQTAQVLGALAPNQASGNDTQRLGFEVNGTISQPSDVDVYSFTGQPGTEVWMQLDRTSMQLNSVIELVDANGSVIASETTDDNGNPIFTGSALPMSQGQLGPAITDPYSINPRDAAMRVVLPGAAGTTNTYYVRIRSDSTNLSNLTGGQSEGLYTLQIRLQQQVQFPGSVVQFANINDSTNGVQVLGQPNLSPLLGESESNTANNSFATAQNLGNILQSNQTTIAVGGDLNSPSQVDWYKFSVNYDLIQAAKNLLSFPLIFDTDYADGLTRADSTIGIYDANGNLIYIGRDSAVPDDQPTPNEGADSQNLAAGSEGSLDPFIGTQQFPTGPTPTPQTYYIAISSSAVLPQTLDQTYNTVATNPLVRLEPIDSVNRVVEDHFTVDPVNATKTSPESSGTAGPANTIFGNSAAQVDGHDVAYTLGNVVLYVTAPINNTSNELYTANASVGGTVTNQSGMPGGFNDITMRNDGELYGITNGSPTPTDTTADNLVQISTANGAQVSSVATGITTYQENPLPGMALNPDGSPNLVAQNTGLQFNALAYQQNGTNRTLYGIASQPNGVVGFTGPLNNLLYQFNGATGQVTYFTVPATPHLVSNAAFTALQVGSGIDAAAATGTTSANDIDPVGSPHTTFTITGPGGPETFEFVTGPAATVPATGGQAVSDGQSFTINGKTFEYTEGLVLSVTGSGATFAEGQTLSVTNSANVTKNYEFVSPGDSASPGFTAIVVGSANSAAQVASAIAAAISGNGVNAQITDSTGTRISVLGVNSITSGAPSLTVSGIANVAAGHLAIPFLEVDTTVTLGTETAAAVNAASLGANASFARDRISFLGATSANFTGSPLTAIAGSSTVTPGNVAVNFSFGDTAGTIANEMATAINGVGGFGVTATPSGGEVLLTGNVGNPTVSSPLTLQSGQGAGTITGMAFIGNTLYAVTNQGSLFTVNNYASVTNASLTYIGNVGNMNIAFTGLTAGPPDVIDPTAPVDPVTGLHDYANDLFATDSSGNLYAILDTTGALQPVFTTISGPATSVPTGIGNATGLAFSTLDYNLWHVTTDQSTAAGHGINAAPDDSRLVTVAGGTSLYFGLDTPIAPGSTGAINTFNQPGNLTPNTSNYGSNPALFNSYNLPGGATGEIVSDSFSLAGYSPYTKPTLYFTYMLNDRDVNGTSNLLDSFRVFVSPDNGKTWTEVATNNTELADAELPAYISSDGGSYRPLDAANQMMQPLFDNTGWRQARIDLGAFAGDGNLELMFSYSTSGVSEQGETGSPLPGDTFGNLDNPGRGQAGLSGQLQGVYVDDIILGFAGRGEMVTGDTSGSTGDTSYFAVPLNPSPFAPGLSQTGPYEFEIRRGTIYGVNLLPTSPALTLVQSFSVNDRLSESISLIAPAGSQISSGQTFTISDGVNSATFEFITSGQTVTSGFVGVTFSAGMSAPQVANAIVSAVNGQIKTNVQAADADPVHGTNAQLNLFNAQSVSNAQTSTTSTMSEDNDSVFDAINTGLSSATPGIFTATGAIGDNPNLKPANEGFDVDMASFQLNAFGSVAINLTAAGAAGANTLVQLFNGAGVVVASSSAGSGGNPLNRTISFTAPAGGTGTYYIGISGSANSTYNIFDSVAGDSGTNGGSFGNYTLTVKIGAAATALQEILYDNMGDTNTPRLQGYTLIVDNTITNASQNGILIGAGARSSNGDPAPGSPRVLPVLNSSALVPGVAVTNNVVADSGAIGIDLLGDPTTGESAAPSLFSRVVNNTVYGGSTPTGVGINVAFGAAPTLMNNIIANTATAVSVDATSNPKTVLVANLYQGNTSNGAGGGELDAIQLAATDKLFVDAANNDFYLAEGSKAIDSSLNSLQDRPNMVQVDAPLGIPAEPIIAPAYDELGQLRVDDPVVSSPPGLGQNVFIDRGALDRADFVDPTTALINPTPTNSSTPNVATIFGQFPSQFSIQFADGTGTGVDPGTVSAAQFTLTGPDPNNPSNTITLQLTQNYLFSYDATDHIVQFTAAAGVWIPGTYTITVNNAATGGVADLAGNPLAPNNASGTTAFTITVAVQGTSPWQNPTNAMDVNNDGSVSAIDALIDINALNAGKGGTLPVPSTAPPYYDVNGDGKLTPLDVLVVINYLNSHTVVTGAVPASAGAQSALAAPTVAATPDTVSDAAVVGDIGFALAAAVPAAGGSASSTNSRATVTAAPSSTASVAAGQLSSDSALVASPSEAAAAAHDSALTSQWYDGEFELESALADMASSTVQLPSNAWSDESDFLS